MNLQNFIALKGSFIGYLSEIEKLSDNYTKDIFLFSELNQVISTVREEVNDSNFIVAVVGVIKRGKSTLLNALLETDIDILSTKVTPETSRLSYLVYSETPFAVIHQLNGEIAKIPFNELPQYTSSYSGIFPKGVKEKVEKTKFAEIHYPNEYLKQGVILVDTPGVDDPEPARSEVTENFISDADAVIFLEDATEGGLKASELNFMMKRIINNKDKSKGIICVINKINALRRHQRSQIPDLVSKTKETIKNKLGIDIPVYTVDALDALNAIRKNDDELFEKSNFKIFKEAIENYLIQEKGTLKLKRIISNFRFGYLSDIIKRIQFEINLKPENLLELEKGLTSLEIEITSLKSRFDIFKKKLAGIQHSLFVWVEKEINEEFSNQIIISKERFDHIPASVIYTINNLKDRFSQKIKNTFIEIEIDFNTKNIRIPQVLFEVENPSVYLSKYKKIENIQIKKNDGASVFGGIIGGVIGFFTAGLLTPVGAYLGYKIGQSFEEQVEIREQVNFDLAGVTKEINALSQSTLKSFQSQINIYFESFESSVNDWFSQQESSIADRRTLISNSKNALESTFAERNQKLNYYLKSLKKIDNDISLINNKLEIINAS